MTTNQEVVTSVDALTTAITDQTEFIKCIPQMKFRVDIMWRILCVISLAILGSGLSWAGYILLTAIRSGGQP